MPAVALGGAYDRTNTAAEEPGGRGDVDLTGPGCAYGIAVAFGTRWGCNRDVL